MTGFGYGLLFGCSPVIGTIPFPSYVLIDSYSIRAFRDGVRTPGHALNLMLERFLRIGDGSL